MDGSFGGVPGAESHAAYAFCTVGALKILGDVDLIDRDKLGMWLSKR
jgi:geranylgeranyl transferase type-2 subunit beta